MVAIATSGLQDFHRRIYGIIGNVMNLWEISFQISKWTRIQKLNPQIWSITWQKQNASIMPWLKMAR
jgi:hypothetical protein